MMKIKGNRIDDGKNFLKNIRNRVCRASTDPKLLYCRIPPGEGQGSAMLRHLFGADLYLARAPR